jgi:2-keto-4-pentenoate hydratase/2-oxohepta-3-ene-1,7-dioic acid hydratase in catechol pathway
MKLLSFEIASPIGPLKRLGAVINHRIFDLNLATRHRFESENKSNPQKLADVLVPPEIIAFLEMGEESLAAARETLEFLSENFSKKIPVGTDGEKIEYSESDIRFLSPVPQPPSLRDFFAFEDHALQASKRRNEPLSEAWYNQPIYYKGNHREIYGHKATIPWPSYTRRFDFELEIACIVGKKGRDISVQDAGKYIAGYTILNDFSARDIQKNEMICRMGPAKGKDFATGLGPYLVTPDEIKNPNDLAMSVSVNGEKWSEGNSGGRYWSFETMISHVSQEETIYPGDILGSGTYYRGCGLDLDRWVNPNDLIELEVEGLGKLANTVGTPKAQKQLKYPKKETHVLDR